MEGNLRRGRPTLCISEAFDFLNDPEYGEKSGKDVQRLKKSVSDTGLLRGDKSNDFDRPAPLLENNTYTILTFVQADQSNVKSTIPNKFEDDVSQSVESAHSDKDQVKYTVVTCVDEAGDSPVDGEPNSMPGVLTDKLQSNQPNTVTPNDPSYLPLSETNRTVNQNESNLPVNDTDSGEITPQVGETTHAQTGETINFQKQETINPQNGEQSMQLDSDNNRKVKCDGSVQNSHSTNQNGGILENRTPSRDHLQSSANTSHANSVIQNGISKSIINIGHSPKSGVNDLGGNKNSLDNKIGSSGDDACEGATNTNTDLVTETADNKVEDEDEAVVLRPPSITSPATPSRRTQQIVSDVFHFLKDIEDDDVVGDLGTENEPSSNDTTPSKVSPGPRKNSLGMMPPVPAPKPKRTSSNAHNETVCSNQSAPVQPESPSRKEGPKSPPAVAPKPRRSTSSQALSSPTNQPNEDFSDRENMQNHTFEINEGHISTNQAVCLNQDIPSSTLNSSMELKSSDSLMTNDDISNSTSGNSSLDPNVNSVDPNVNADSIVNSDPSVNSDTTVIDSDRDSGAVVETEARDSGPSQEDVPSSPVKMRPSLSRSEAIDDTQDNVGTVEPLQEQTLTLRRKKSRTRSATNEEDSADSSDDDTGIYNESYRKSCWIQIAEEDTSSRSASPARPSTLQTMDEADTDTAPQTGPAPGGDTNPVSESQSNPPPSHQDSKDDVFVEGVAYKEGRFHKRSDSTTTTRSESEFKREYQFRRKCFVQRSDSQQEYHRFSAKFYDHERHIVINRSETTSDLGLHILDSHPAVITSVDPGSPAEKAGVKKGQIILSVNQVNVLQATHAEIVSLIQESSLQVSLELASSDVSLVRDLQSPKVSGFMHKLSSSTFVRNWKKRYFVLRKDNCLYYYKNDLDCTDPLGALPLLNYTVSKHTDTSKSHCFKAEKYGAKTYYFYVDTREDMARWVCAMNEAAMASKKRKDSWMDITSHNVGLPALEIRRAECTGYLRKSNKAMKNWNRRYCVLKDACLYYYKTMNAQNAQGMAHLHGYRVDMTGIPLKAFSFVLQPPETQMRTFYFVAENETDKLRWVESLRKSIDRWIQMD